MSFEKLHQYLASIIPGERIPGCDIVVYHKGEQVYREQFGYGDYPRTQPVNPDDHYILYSCSKVVTCAAVMHLVEEGRLGLDDPVSQYLPAFAELYLKDGSRAKNVLTIRHLFTMTGGLDYTLKTRFMCELLRHKPDATSVEIAQAIAKWPLSFEPGTHYQYSLCHDVLAAVAEVVTGKSFKDYVREWAFAPLGLADIDYGFTENNRTKLAPQYLLGADEKTLHPLGNENIYIFTPNHFSGGAGLIATAQDYTRFLSALAQGNLLRKETMERMRTNQLTESQLEELHRCAWLKAHGYGLGVRTLIDPEKAGYRAPIGEIGWDGAAGAYALIDPDRELAIGYFQGVKSCQFAYNEVHPTVRDLVYEALGYQFK